MRWQYKAMFHGFFSFIPAGTWLYYLAQRYITKTLPISEAKFLNTFKIESIHIENFRKFGSSPIGDAKLVQFGAGWTLAGPLSFYCHNAKNQILFDLHKWVKPFLINNIIVRLQNSHLFPSPARIPSQLIADDETKAIEDLKTLYGIEYRAPADMRNSNLAPESVDYISSTSTLEHIPREDIKKILTECYRILKPDGVVSFCVDYQDHYAGQDRTISVYNFLKYSSSRWRLFNPPFHYQNRLRHVDLKELYRQAGFEILSDSITQGSQEDIEILKTMSLSPCFKDYSLEDLAMKMAISVLKKRSDH